MRVFFPQESPKDFSSFIIAFEFVQTPDEVTNLFKLLDPDPAKTDTLSAAEKITGLNIGNYVDFAFMLVYSLFLFFYFKKAADYFGLKWLRLALPLAALAFICDFAENICLLNITDAYVHQTEMGGSIAMLPYFVWTKWLSLAVLLALGSIAFLHGRKLITKLLAFVLILPVLLGIMALISQAGTMIDGFTVSIFIGLLILLLSCFWLE